MKFPFGFPHLNQKPDDAARVLIHGDTIHRYDGAWTAAPYSLPTLKKTLTVSSRPLVFLASPFADTYLHETIHLSASELETADQQLLGFGEPCPDEIRLYSYKLSEKKAITIHAHLTEKGSALLREMRQQGIRITWHPASAGLVSGFLQQSDPLTCMGSRIRIFLGNEVFQVERQAERLRFEHLTYLQGSSGSVEKPPMAEQILDQAESRPTFNAIRLDDQGLSPAIAETAEFAHALQPPVRGGSRKTVKRSKARQRQVFKPLLKRNHLLGVAAAATVVWAIMLQLHVSDINRERQRQRAAVSELTRHSEQLGRIGEMQRQLLRYRSVGKAVQELMIQPADLLEKLDVLLPKGVWVQDFLLTDRQLTLKLLDSSETELSALMEQLGRAYGQTSLKSNEAITLKAIPLRRYAIDISKLKFGGQDE